MDVQAPRSKAVPRIPGPSAIPTAIVSVDSASSTKSFIGRQTGYKLFQPLSQTWVSISDIRYQNNGVHSMYDIYTTTPGNYIANGYLDPLKDEPHYQFPAQNSAFQNVVVFGLTFGRQLTTFIKAIPSNVQGMLF